jgi:hypothetical protein
MTDKPANTIFPKAEHLLAREQTLRILAARQKAEEAVARIAAGAPRESFGPVFALFFETIEAGPIPTLI